MCCDWLLFLCPTERSGSYLKRKILLYLLNLIRGRKGKSNENDGKNVRRGCGCLLAIGCGTFLPIFAFMAVIVWVASSVFSCAAPVVLDDILGVPISEEDEKMLRGEYEAEKERYGGVQEYFVEKKLVGTAPIAQAFYLLYMDRVLARPDTYLQDLAYCFADGVKLRNIQRVKERFGIEMTEEDLNVVLEYARDTRIPTENYRTYKNATDLAKFASWAAGKWKYRENTAGDVLTADQIFRSQDIDDWMMLGQRTADNTGIYKAYLWLDNRSGEIKLTDYNTQDVQRYSTGKDIVKKTEWKIPKDEIEYYYPAGLGVYREKDGQIGVLTDEGVVTASAANGLKEMPFDPDEWSYAFYFPGIEYETITSSYTTIHITVYSNKYTHAWLEFLGYHNHVCFPLYFVDGVAETESEFIEPPDTLHATFYWEDGSGIRYEFFDPEPEYGSYKDFDITPKDEYMTIEYVLD